MEKRNNVATTTRCIMTTEYCEVVIKQNIQIAES
jgi:hypothetical protein